MGASDRYCLRWNNHQANLLSVMDDLLKNQTLTDVTLGVEDGRFLKCHKVILATCSPYFRTLFIEVPTNHPIILLKDVRYTEVKAILEFMYRGEVSVAYDDLGALFQVAELLQVKGLVASNELSSGNEATAPPSPTVCSTSGNRNDEAARTSESVRSNSSRPHSAGAPISISARASGHQDVPEPTIPAPAWPMPQLFPTDEQKSAVAALANFHPFLPAQAFPFSQFRDNVSESSSARFPRAGASTNNGATHHQDPSILRAVLNPEHDDGIRIPIIHQDSQSRNRRNRSTNKDDRRGSMDLSHSQGAPSPREHEASMMDDEDKRENPQTFGDDAKYGVGGYGTSQRQEIKRYKKYSRKDIWDAIAAVKGGLSANKAAELFSVPSRTLYDKIKKLGIPPTKHRRSENPANTGGLQYDIAGNVSNAGLESTTKNTREDFNDSIENPASAVETAYTENREKSTDPEDTIDATRQSPRPGIHRDNSHSRSSNESQFKDDEDEAEDLTVNRRSNVHVIVSANSAIQETA